MCSLTSKFDLLLHISNFIMLDENLKAQSLTFLNIALGHLIIGLAFGDTCLKHSFGLRMLILTMESAIRDLSSDTELTFGTCF